MNGNAMVQKPLGFARNAVSPLGRAALWSSVLAFASMQLACDGQIDPASGPEIDQEAGYGVTAGSEGYVAGAGGTLSGAAGSDGMAGMGSAAGSPADGGSGGEPVDVGNMPPMRSSGCGAGEWPANGNHSLDVDGTERTFIVETPEGYDPNTPYRLVFAWHGFTRSASQIAAPTTSSGVGQFFGLEPLSGSSAIFVAGQGLDTTLLGITAPGWDDEGGRDVAFARALVDFMRSSYCIDDARIFSTGSSMGGYMSNQLGCEMKDVFRAVASMMGGGPLPLNGVRCSDRMPAWITHGTQDTINAYRQGQASRDHWALVNHCSAQTTAVAPAGCVAYEGCDEGYPVHWCEFEGGHVIPEFAAEGMWSFFSQF